MLKLIFKNKAKKETYLISLGSTPYNLQAPYMPFSSDNLVGSVHLDVKELFVSNCNNQDFTSADAEDVDIVFGPATYTSEARYTYPEKQCKPITYEGC